MARVLLWLAGHMSTPPRHIRWVLLAAVSGLFASPAVAQTKSNLPVVTLEQALRYARQHQPAIRSALAEYQARRAEARVPRAAWLPQVGATAQLFGATSNQTTASYLGVPEVDLPRVGGSRGRTQATATWTPQASTLAGLSVAQEVYDFGRISAEIAVADAFAAMAKAGAEAAALDAELGVEEAFHSVLAAKDILAATEDAYKRAVTHRNYAQAGTRSGLRPPIDLTRAQADVAQLEVRRIRAQAGLQVARAALAAAMGSDAPAVDAAPTSADLKPGPAFQEALRVAAQKNPAILSAMAKLDAQQANVKAVGRELLPNLFASAGLNGRAGGEVPSSGNPADVPYGDGWLPDVVNWHLGLVLQWNLFDGTVLARRAAAQARAQAARADLDLAKMNVDLSTKRAWLDLNAALEAIPGLQAAVGAARANEAQADARFKAGLGTIVELADAEALLTNAQLELAIGQFGVARARAALGRVMGQSITPANREGRDQMSAPFRTDARDSHPDEPGHSEFAPSDDGRDGGGTRARLVIVVGVGAVLAAMIGMYLRAAARTNHVALADAPKAVSVLKARATTFRPVRTYVGTTQPWNAARIGPQYVSAYVGTVLVRPGAVVKRGEVLATLDCRNASAASKEIAAKAEALEERQAAIEHEAERTKEMQAGGFASANELEQLTAKSAAEKAEVESLRASLVSRTLEVNDCVLRAPFNGEVSDRYVDPGAYVRPGNAVVRVIDRKQVRVVADAPESDFAVIAPGTPVQIAVEATGARLDAVVSRRAPAADEVTRTIHFEVDIPNDKEGLPVGSTARLSIEFGDERPATQVPLAAATIRGAKATVFTVDGDVARRVAVPVLGEAGGMLYVDPKLKAGTPIVVEGRALLDDGDRVKAAELKL